MVWNTDTRTLPENTDTTWAGIRKPSGNTDTTTGIENYGQGLQNTVTTAGVKKTSSERNAATLYHNPALAFRPLMGREGRHTFLHTTMFHFRFTTSSCCHQKAWSLSNSCEKLLNVADQLDQNTSANRRCGASETCS